MPKLMALKEDRLAKVSKVAPLCMGVTKYRLLMPMP